jgi:hypothetical protein
MSYLTWTADALRSNFRTLAGICWRVVEAQHRVSTLKLVDTRKEQERLEELLEKQKPPLPTESSSYHYLLFTPFRYPPYGRGSRFRRPDQREGAYYSAENIDTAMAEIAFYKLLFFYESPDTPIPDSLGEFTAFSVKYKTKKGIDLTEKPLANDENEWTNKKNREGCQFLADQVRIAGGEAIKSLSVRCPNKGKNIAILSLTAFVSKDPEAFQTWQLSIKPQEVVAICESPRKSLVFDRPKLENDPYIMSLKKKASS